MRAPSSSQASALARLLGLGCRVQSREAGLLTSQAEGVCAAGSPGQKGHSLWEGFQMPKELPALDQLHVGKHFPVLVGPKEALECF